MSGLHKRLTRDRWPDVMARLAEVYREVEREPVPERFLKLIERLSAEADPADAD
ncbi:hypothetical protein GCM10009101_06920 [Brevundimonas lenta]